MEFEAYRRAEEEYRADVKRLTKIANEVYNGNYGYFLKVMADAWIVADSANRRIIKRAWAAIVRKYDLEAEGVV